MCGPSSGLKAINTQIQNFTNQVTAEAGTIFSGVSSVFNKIVGSLSGIIAGGPSQQGFSAGQLSAEDAAAVNAGATEARNLSAAAASSVGAIGGGNVVAPSGTTTAEVLGAKTQAAADTAAALNQITQADWQQGNTNFWAAEKDIEQAPSAFNAANTANEVAGAQQKTAFQSQQEIDNQSNWWAQDIMQLGSAAVGGMAGGIGMGMGIGKSFKAQDMQELQGPAVNEPGEGS